MQFNDNLINIAKYCHLKYVKYLQKVKISSFQVKLSSYTNVSSVSDERNRKVAGDGL